MVVGRNPYGKCQIIAPYSEARGWGQGRRFVTPFGGSQSWREGVLFPRPARVVISPLRCAAMSGSCQELNRGEKEAGS